MAKILYGVAGEGSGHSSRAKEIIRYLERKGHIVKIITHSQGYKNLSPFFDTFKIAGFRFVYKNNEVQYLPTLFKNLLNLPQIKESIDRVGKLVEEFQPQLVFTDFETISSIVANLKNLPLISIDNQHRLTNTKIEYPKKYETEALTAKTIVNLIVFNPKIYLITSFFKTQPIKKILFCFHRF